MSLRQRPQVQGLLRELRLARPTWGEMPGGAVSYLLVETSPRGGVTHALVHQYVGSKQDLLNAVIQRVAQDRVVIAHEAASLREAVDAILSQILANPVHTKSLVRSAMDGVEYVSLRQRIETGRALVELADATAASGAAPAPPPRGLDHRVVMAALTALSFGWGAIEDWLWPIYGLDSSDKDEVYRQLGQIAAYLADLVLQPGDGDVVK